MISAADKRILETLAEKVGAFTRARVLAFGSRARGEATWESDFESALCCRKRIKWLSRLSVKCAGKSDLKTKGS